MLIALVLVFSLWLTLTVAIQFNSSFAPFISRWDALGLLPRWTFFAPNPGHTDIRVLVRFGGASGITSWSELWLSSRVDDRRTVLRGIFNPYRRVEKLLFDFRNELIDPTINAAQVRMSSEYIALLATSEMVARIQGVDTVQFMLAETNYTLTTPFKVVMISDMHRVSMPAQP